MEQTRRLSAIMFADIAGYTALMQHDEEGALAVLNRFKKTLEEESERHGGRIVQYFGDGCLLSFDSSTQAVSCAISMQQAFLLAPAVPVRIGLHLGEVVFTPENVFGDGVNVASRVESLGVSGSILLSKTIRDQVKNKPGFKLRHMGNFDFKNVDEPMAVFAVANQGLVVPKREEMQGKLKQSTAHKRSRWKVPAIFLGAVVIAVASWFIIQSLSKPTLSKELRQKPVAVLAFDNETKDSDLDAFGMMAKDWISQGLLESGQAQVIKEVGEITTAGIGSIEKSPVPKEAEVLIKGRYFSPDQQRLVVTADILDVHSNKVYYSVSPLSGRKDEPMKLLVALQQRILGFWNLKDLYLSKNPPRYDAYEAYIKGLSLQEGFPYTQKIAYFQKALELDENFAEPLFALYNICHWGLVTTVCDTVLAGLRAREDQFSDYQQLRWQNIRALRAGEMEKAAAIEWKLYESFHLESNAQMAIHEYRYANNLKKVLELYTIYKKEETHPDENVTGMAVSAMYDLGQYDAALKEINDCPKPVRDLDIAVVHLRILARQQKMKELDEKIAFYKHEPLQFGGFYKPPMLLFSLVEELYMMDEKDALAKYLPLLENWLNETGEDYLFYHHHKAVVHYMRGNYHDAYELGKELWQKHQLNFFAGLTGVCLLKMGREKDATAYMEEVKTRPVSFSGAIPYALGVIESHRDPSLAVTYLERSMQEGYEYNWYAYRHDYLLREIKDYRPFIELTAPK